LTVRLVRQAEQKPRHALGDNEQTSQGGEAPAFEVAPLLLAEEREQEQPFESSADLMAR
jgi:hypothetical protein